MTLDRAILKVLREQRRSMTPQELAEVLNERGWLKARVEAMDVRRKAQRASFLCVDGHLIRPA